MKRFLLTFSFVVLAMVTFAATFNLGLKAGYNSSKLSGNVSNFTSNADGGYAIGAFGRFGGKLYIQPEFLYVVNNSNLTVGTAKDALKTKFIQVPLLLGLKLLDLKVVQLHAFTGPAVAFSSGYESSQNLKYNLSKSTWDYQLGAGLDLLIFTLDVRYSWGLSNRIDTSDIGSNFSSKANAFRVSLGIKFM